LPIVNKIDSDSGILVYCGAFYRGAEMKLIVAVVRPHRVQEVKEALSGIGVTGLTVTDVRGAGKQKGQIERYRGSEYSVDLLSKCKIEVATTDDQCEDAIQAIRKSAYTGEIGDGKIFVLTLEDSMRIRTGERGEDSL
jgi:nitrogen regulatory protein PII